MLLSDLGKDIIEFSKKNALDEFNMLERILIYCEEKELNVCEVGDKLKSDKFFKSILEDDLKDTHYIKKEENAIKEADLSDW
jgi:hypothetical protein